ncbi:RNA polymerase sigma factor [Patescibacteria group bacterium]|nr:RNA polymerase sigma factor [Patescibacteria group bacterium]
MTFIHPARIETPDEMLDKARQGDTKSFGQIYELWAESIYRYTYLKTKNEFAAEDLTAETFLKAWKGLKTFKPKPEVKFSTWLFSIARNTVIDYYRTVKQEISFDNLPEIEDVEGGKELYGEQHELRDKLAHLRPEYREVLELRYVQDISISKVAQIMKKKEGNIRTLTNRALAALKKELS